VLDGVLPAEADVGRRTPGRDAGRIFRRLVLAAVAALQIWDGLPPSPCIAGGRVSPRWRCCGVGTAGADRRRGAGTRSAPPDVRRASADDVSALAKKRWI